MSGAALYGQQLYTKAAQGNPDFFRNFSEDINCVVQEFAKGRLAFYGIRAKDFKLWPSVHYEFGSGETVTGFVLEGDFYFDHVQDSETILEYMANVIPLEHDGPEQSGCDIQPCIKLYLTEGRKLHGASTNYINKAFGHPKGLDVTGKPEHDAVMRAFGDLHDRIGDLCMSLMDELEDFYDERVVDWSDKKRGF